MNPDYAAFLESKSLRAKQRGLQSFAAPAEHLFPFQAHCVDFLLRTGCGGLFLGTGLGKQQPISEPVLTPIGWLPIGDLKIGDFVIGSNGLPTRVLGVYPQGIHSVWRIEISDGSFVRTGIEHLWSVRTKSDKHQEKEFRTLSTRSILETIHREWQLPMFTPLLVVDDVDLPIHPYTLGAVLGDGTFGKMVSVCTDNWIGEQIGWRKWRDHETCDYVGYWFAPNDIFHSIDDLGLAKKTSHEKFIPATYLMASPTQRLALLQGLLDTDGYAMPDGGVEFSSTSADLVSGVAELTRSLGGVARGLRRAASTFTYQGEKRQGKPAWRINLKLPGHFQMFRLPRKADQYCAPTKYPPCRIIRDVVDEQTSEQQVCIEVAASDQLYVTRDHILTHNTEIQLDWCQKIIEATNKPALILTPLAVAGQTRRRAERWGNEACIVREQCDVKRDRINICNYERMEKLDLTEFGAVSLDEASILKSFTGKTTQALIAAFGRHRFKLAATATPAPNDYMEFGNYAEFLDVMSANEMLSRFFINDTSQASQKWRLKNNAVEAFWDWIASYSRMADMPSDLGDKDDGFVLEPFQVVSHKARDSEIINTSALHDMFGVTSLSATNLHDIKRQTIEARAEVTARIVNAERNEPWILWVNTNYEADAIRKVLPNAIEVRGSQTAEEKEEKLNAFALGQIRVLIGKPAMVGFGCDWSHCARHAFVGRDFSWETWYQAVRRCWRFGQKRQVVVHLIVAEGEDAIGAVLDRKSEDNEKMKVAMRAAMRRAAGLEAQRREIYNPTHKVRLVPWLSMGSR